MNFEEDKEDETIDTERWWRKQGRRGKCEWRRRCRESTMHQFGVDFNGVEKSMSTFSQDDKTIKWVDEFEKMSGLCDWTEIQKIIYAKWFLRDSAKLIVSYEQCSKSWKYLKKALLCEFASKVNSRMVHKELSQCKKDIWRNVSIY